MTSSGVECEIFFSSFGFHQIDRLTPAVDRRSLVQAATPSYPCSSLLFCRAQHPAAGRLSHPCGELIASSHHAIGPTLFPPTPAKDPRHTRCRLRTPALRIRLRAGPHRRPPSSYSHFWPSDRAPSRSGQVSWPAVPGRVLLMHISAGLAKQDEDQEIPALQLIYILPLVRDPFAGPEPIRSRPGAGLPGRSPFSDGQRPLVP